MRLINGCNIRTSVLWVIAALCAVAPAHADIQAAPVSVIEVITAEVPASLLTEEDRPDHGAVAQASAPLTDPPQTREKTELGSAIFNPLSQTARQHSGTSGKAASSTLSAWFAWDIITFVAVLSGVVAIVLLAHRQRPNSNS